MISNEVSPTLFKMNFNKDVFTFSIEIDRLTNRLIRKTGRFNKNQIVTINKNIDSITLNKQFVKLYNDKINDGYRPIIVDLPEFNKLYSFLSIGSFTTTINSILTKYKDIEYYTGVTQADNKTESLHLSFIRDHIPATNCDKNDITKPMKAKPFVVNKMVYPALGQGKLNGVRTTIHYNKPTPKVNELMFDTPTATVNILSREGIEYNVPHLQQELLALFETNVLDCNLVYDGEIYLPGIPVTTISGAARNINNPVNRNLLYVIFDISDDVLIQIERDQILQDISFTYLDRRFTNYLNKSIYNKEYNITSSNIHVYILPSRFIQSDEEFIEFTNECIDSCFEGGILRNLNSLYQFGSRNYTMMKLKRPSFIECIVVDVIPMHTDITQGMFLLENDINEDTFECNINASHSDRRRMLINKQLWIGTKVKVRFYERTVNMIPFHANVIIEDE